MTKKQEETKGVKKAGRGARLVGVVVSDASDKTINVRIDRLIKHPLYKKYIRRSSKIQAHDDGNKAKLGDKVSLVSHRPISKSKRFVLAEVLTAKQRKSA